MNQEKPTGMIRMFAMYDMRENGETRAAIARHFGIKPQQALSILLRFDSLCRTHGIDAMLAGRELAERLQVSSQLYAGLLRQEITTIEQLLAHLKRSDRRYNKIQGLGSESWKRLESRLQELGYDTNEVPIVSIPLQLSKEDWRVCLDYWDHKCAVCGHEPEEWETLHQDHWIPRALVDICPGTSLTNIVPLCIDCNTQKTDMGPFVWLVSTLGQVEDERKMREVFDYFDWCRKRDGHGD